MIDILHQMENKSREKSVPSGVYMPMYHIVSGDHFSVFWYKQKCMMGGLLLSIPVGSQMTKCLVTYLHGWNYAWEKKLDEVHTYFDIKQQVQEDY